MNRPVPDFNAAAADDMQDPGATEGSSPANDFRAVPSPVPGRESGGEAVADAGSGDTPGTGGRADVRRLQGRVERLERHNNLLKLAMVLLMVVAGVAVFERLFPDGVVIQRTLMESREIKLLDNDGNARLFLRMYSRVPVLQLLDAAGKPRMSLGLRFDDTPFLDLSDRRGNTRATLEITEDDEPALQLYDENGNVKFKIN